MLGNGFQKHLFQHLPRYQDKADGPVIAQISFLHFLKIGVVFADLEIISEIQVHQYTSLFSLGLGKTVFYLETILKVLKQFLGLAETFR